MIWKFSDSSKEWDEIKSVFFSQVMKLQCLRTISSILNRTLLAILWTYHSKLIKKCEKWMKFWVNSIKIATFFVEEMFLKLLIVRVENLTVTTKKPKKGSTHISLLIFKRSWTLTDKMRPSSKNPLEFEYFSKLWKGVPANRNLAWKPLANYGGLNVGYMGYVRTYCDLNRWSVKISIKISCSDCINWFNS